jgi:hypothetical protein
VVAVDQAAEGQLVALAQGGQQGCVVVEGGQAGDAPG